MDRKQWLVNLTVDEALKFWRKRVDQLAKTSHITWHQRAGMIGGRSRAKRLSPEERSRIAGMGGRAKAARAKEPVG